MDPAKTREMSQPGSTVSATVVYGKRGTLLRRVKFFMETVAIRLVLAADFLSGWVDLAELHELVVVLAASLRNKCAFVRDVLGEAALPVAAIAYGTHDTEVLGTARKTANKRRRTLVLPA